MKKSIIAALVIGITFLACSDSEQQPADAGLEQPAEEEKKVEDADPMKNKGIGPITSLELGEVDDAMAAEGLDIFTAKCTACHKVEKRYIGPELLGIMERRSPEWIMNMILNPEEMTTKDPIAKQLLIEYTSPMANQSLTEDESRKILEYFRTI